MRNPILGIQSLGQSIWLDFIRRDYIVSGELERMIREDGIRGVTVNPSILEKAVTSSTAYDEAIYTLALEGYSSSEMYEALAIEDVKKAASLFMPLYEKSLGKYGFVSLEVSPLLAHDPEGTIEEAHRFWGKLNLPNVMIKVPSTVEGLAVIEDLTEEGINVNVTLLFGLKRYQQVIDAYINGLQAGLAAGHPLHNVRSVASFFLSRIDAHIDPILEKTIETGGAQSDLAAHLHGQVAIASARMAYQLYKETTTSEVFKLLADEGARSQQLVWASTGTKNPDYSDIKYVEALIGAETINTIPLETLEAYRDHGQPQPRLEKDLEFARQVFDSLPGVGIDLEKVTQGLEEEGIDKFVRSYNGLLKTLEDKSHSVSDDPHSAGLSLPESLHFLTGKQ